MNATNIRKEFHVYLMRYGALNRMITKARIDGHTDLENTFVDARHETQMKIADLLDKAFAKADEREALVVTIGQASDPALTYEACERLADALLATGWTRKF